MRLIRRHPVLKILMGIAFGGLLVLLVAWPRGGRMPSGDPMYKLRNGHPVAPTWEQFTWKNLDREPTQVFSFLLNHPDKCNVSGGVPFLLMLVMTQSQDQGLRNAIRHTWGNETAVPGVVILRLFLMGLSSDQSSHHLLEEDKKHGDLLQGDFLDTYHNKTLKTLMGLEWVAQHCPMIHYVLKVNGNDFNPSFLVQQILKPEQRPRPDFITSCIYRNRIPIQKQYYLQYMPQDMLSHARYPPFCCNPGYVMSGHLALKVFSKAQGVPVVQLEEVSVGLCLHQLEVEPTLSPPNTFFMFGRLYNHCDFPSFALIYPFKHQQFLQSWPDFQ